MYNGGTIHVEKVLTLALNVFRYTQGYNYENLSLTGEANFAGLLATTRSFPTMAANSRKPDAPFANSTTTWRCLRAGW